MPELNAIRTEEYRLSNLSCCLLFDDYRYVCAVILKGSMDTLPVTTLMRMFKENVLPYLYNFVVDLQGVTFIGSTGFSLLMTIVRFKRDFIFVSYPDADISKPFRLLGINSLFRYYMTVDELKSEPSITATMIESLKKHLGTPKEIQHHERWVKILSDFLDDEPLWKELQQLDPYVNQAEYTSEVTLPSEEKYACILYRFLRRIFNEAPVAVKDAFDDNTIELIVKELMSNAVQHGYEGKKDGVVEAMYKTDRDKIEISIIDYGRGYPQKPDDTSASLGLELINKIFDKVEIAEAPQKKVTGLVLGKGTTVRMTKFLGSKPK